MFCSKDYLMQFLHGVSDLADMGDGSYRLYRIPQILFPELNERIQLRSYSQSGTEIRFKLSAAPVRITLRRIPEPGHPVFTPQSAIVLGLYRGDLQQTWLALQEGDNEIEIKPVFMETEIMRANRSRFSPELVRIILPAFVEVRIAGFSGNPIPPAPGDLPETTCLAYGSSITQGAYSVLGNTTYPAVIGRELAVDIINQGYGGGAFLESRHAEWLVSRHDWHFATAELGANLFHLSKEDFRSATRKFLEVFANGDSRQRPLFVLDLLPNTGDIKGDENRQHAAELRTVVREEVVSLAVPRIIQLHYATLLPRVADYSLDYLHPSALAFETIGVNLANQIRNALDTIHIPRKIVLKPLPSSYLKEFTNYEK